MVATSKIDRASWRTSGFAVLPEVVSANELATLRAAFAEVMALPWAKQMAERRGWVLVHKPESFSEIFSNSRANEVALECARALIGDAVISHRVLWNKPPHSAGPIPWHQDDSYKLEDADAFDSLGFWLALDDVTVESGCLEFIAGDYREPLVDHVAVAGAEWLREVAVAPAAEAPVVACPISAGDALVFSSRTLHRSSPNLSSGPRRVMASLIRAPRQM